MFELPNNTTPQVRPDVVNRLVAAMFEKGHLDYCDWYVSMDGKPGFAGKWSGPRGENDKRKFVEFTMDERQAAFDEFKKKGYHIAREEWYGTNSRLWCYIVKEKKDTPEDHMFHYIF